MRGDSGDTERMRAGKHGRAVERARVDSCFGHQRTVLSCPQPMSGGHASRHVKRSTGERRQRPSVFFHSRLPLRAMASMARSRHAAPGVPSACDIALSRGGIDNRTPRRATAAWRGSRRTRHRRRRCPQAFGQAAVYPLRIFPAKFGNQRPRIVCSSPILTVSRQRQPTAQQRDLCNNTAANHRNFMQN
jgi:hypothetical protein